MKSSDEIKKGLECCITDNCRECPYYLLYSVFGCKLERAKDALALIQQLQADNAQLNRCIENMTDKLNAMNDEAAKLQAERDVLDYTLAGVMHFVDKWLDVKPYKIDGPTGNDAVTRAALAREIALKAIEQAEAERDAAVRDMTAIVQDTGEPYCDYCGADFKPKCTGHCWTHNEGFKWRGVQKEE